MLQALRRIDATYGIAERIAVLRNGIIATVIDRPISSGSWLWTRFVAALTCFSSACWQSAEAGAPHYQAAR